MRKFNIENYKLTDEQLIYFFSLTNVDELIRLSNRIDKVIKNIFGIEV